MADKYRHLRVWGDRRHVKDRNIPKKAFASYQEALDFVRQKDGKRTQAQVYRCPVCKLWHFGHKKVSAM